MFDLRTCADVQRCVGLEDEAAQVRVCWSAGTAAAPTMQTEVSPEPSACDTTALWVLVSLLYLWAVAVVAWPRRGAVRRYVREWRRPRKSSCDLLQDEN